MIGICKFDMLRMSRLATDCKCDAYGIDIVAGIVHLEELFRGARLQGVSNLARMV